MEELALFQVKKVQEPIGDRNFGGCSYNPSFYKILDLL